MQEHHGIAGSARELFLTPTAHYLQMFGLHFRWLLVIRAVRPSGQIPETLHDMLAKAPFHGTPVILQCSYPLRRNERGQSL